MGLERRQFTELLPKLLRKPSLLIKDPDVMAEAIPLFGFMVPLLHIFLIPGLLYAQYAHKNTPTHERNLLVGQEFVNHLIGAAIHVIMFISGGALARQLIIKRNPTKFPMGSRAQKDAETIACMIGGFLGATFVKPILSATIIEDYIKKPDSPSQRPRLVNQAFSQNRGQNLDLQELHKIQGISSTLNSMPRTIANPVNVFPVSKNNSPSIYFGRLHSLSWRSQMSV